MLSTAVNRSIAKGMKAQIKRNGDKNNSSSTVEISPETLKLKRQRVNQRKTYYADVMDRIAQIPKWRQGQRLDLEGGLQAIARNGSVRLYGPVGQPLEVVVCRNGIWETNDISFIQFASWQNEVGAQADKLLEADIIPFDGEPISPPETGNHSYNYGLEQRG